MRKRALDTHMTDIRMIDTTHAISTHAIDIRTDIQTNTLIDIPMIDILVTPSILSGTKGSVLFMTTLFTTSSLTFLLTSTKS